MRYQHWFTQTEIHTLRCSKGKTLTIFFKSLDSWKWRNKKPTLSKQQWKTVCIVNTLKYPLIKPVQGSLMTYTAELAKYVPTQDFKQWLSGNMIPRNVRVVFSESNWRRRHGLFSTLQPAECCEISGESWAERREWGCQQVRRGNLRCIVEENRTGKDKREDWQGTTAVNPATKRGAHADSQWTANDTWSTFYGNGYMYNNLCYYLW